MKNLTQSRLKELLIYNPETGLFTRRIRIYSFLAGEIAGTLKDNGYVVICLDRALHRAHRLAFLYMTGKLPNDDVDHINNNRSDNRWSNLRECTRSQNLANAGKRITNKSGYKGVCWAKNCQKWKAEITFNYKNIHLGLFECKHEAAKAFNKKALELFGEFAYLNEIKL